VQLQDSLEPAGRTALVTGAGSGIGAALAMTLARAGARVALLGRNPVPLERTAWAIAAAEGEALPVPCDVTREAEVLAAIGQVSSALGPVEILVNNAGAAFSAPLEATSDADLDRLLDLNVRAPYRLATLLVPLMRERGFGRVINIGSTASHRGFRYCALYTATKHALAGWTRSLAAECQGSGVTANLLCPGYVATPLVDRAVERIVEKSRKGPEEVRAHLAAQNPLGRLLEPEEVAAAAMVFLGPAGGTLNGHSLLQDGGTQPV
jgi:NAD(P)-dependent dehydrogenase (short-subunit alcohol dehydrogenase family)